MERNGYMKIYLCENLVYTFFIKHLSLIFTELDFLVDTFLCNVFFMSLLESHKEGGIKIGCKPCWDHQYLLLENQCSRFSESRWSQNSETELKVYGFFCTMKLPY